MQPAGLRGQRRHPHGATLAGPAENERDPGAERLSGVAGRATASRPASQTAPEPLVPFPPPAPARGPGSAGGAMPNAAGRGGITPAGSSLLRTRTTPVLSDMPHGTEVSSPVERGYMMIEAAKEAVYIIETELGAMRETLADHMEVLTDPLEITAVQMRYMDGRSVREIAYSLNYSEQHIFRVLNRAEKKILHNK